MAVLEVNFGDRRIPNYRKQKYLIVKYSLKFKNVNRRYNQSSEYFTLDSSRDHIRRRSL